MRRIQKPGLKLAIIGAGPREEDDIPAYAPQPNRSWYLGLPVMFEKMANTIDRASELLSSRKKNDTEMVGFRIIKTATLHHENFFLLK